MSLHMRMRARCLQADLIRRGVCSPHKAKLVIQERCLPLVGQRQAKFEKDLEAMDVSAC